MHDRNAVDDGEHAALAAENAVLDVVALDLMKRRGDQIEVATTVGAPQDVEGTDVHELTTRSPSCSITESQPASSGERLNCSVPSRPRACCSVMCRSGWVGPICVR